MREDPETRSRIMRAVKSRDTAPEMTVRSMIHRMGYRFRLHRKDLPGKPDIVFPSLKRAIFVHGCFWHGHDCARGDRAPKANADYWQSKIARNRNRDASNTVALRTAGWQVAVIWECQLKDDASLRKLLSEFLRAD